MGRAGAAGSAATAPVVRGSPIGLIVAIPARGAHTLGATLREVGGRPLVMTVVQPAFLACVVVVLPVAAR